MQYIKLLLQFVAFLERLSRTLNMDELTQDTGVELHTESIMHRAEQLARLESDKIVDKVSQSLTVQRITGKEKIKSAYIPFTHVYILII